ncbi:CPBP family intramembrane glutamic endopeptidase [Nonomuraea turcica]|uniref:CPBP family intramembrane glutamic endopeptidase n=1 Tax=Nonomuraea sp. G32 TaxID=3067274 RepID=UPI00273C46EF|nr:CPBP family intramembrane glutamic endopeptidase [Nonomuraea sp. G32]MDP4511289.1 CPBP family intramembrane metalloprotease [Nonomuraea sp. G32]
MDTAMRPPADTQGAQPKGFVAKLLADRHSVPFSIALHLVPGAVIVAVYAFLAAPLVRAMDFPIFLAWAIALAVVLFPLQLFLLWLGKKQTGRFTMKGVVHYRDKPVSRGKVFWLGTACLVWMSVVSLSLTPLDNIVYDWFFTWVDYQGAGPDGTAYLQGYPQELVLTTLLICAPFTGFTLPLLEEYYFRGFLLPRLPQLGKWAPFFNTFFFSMYHFWAPWTVLSKLVFLYPGIWLAWKKQDIRISIAMHPGSALLITVVGVIALASGAYSI